MSKNTEKHFDKISDIRLYNENIVCGNTVVGHRQRFQYQQNGENYWYTMGSHDEMRKIDGISNLDYMSNVEMTPEGKKLFDEWKAEQDEEDDD